MEWWILVALAAVIIGIVCSAPRDREHFFNMTEDERRRDGWPR